MNAGELIRRTRTARRLTQSVLAARAGISRQALGAIESGTYRPGVSVALSLARELGTNVENLFGAEADESPRHVAASFDDRDAPRGRISRTRVALGRVGGRVVAVAQVAARLALAPAGGVLEKAAGNRAEVATFLSRDEVDSTLLIAGCDPGVAILAEWLARQRSPVGAISLAGSSRKALTDLLQGRVHAAGVHLRDAKSGEYNLGPVRQALGKRRAVVINFAQWEMGLATASGNPHGLRGFADLARPNLKIVNRELGSGARAALDEALKSLGLPAARVAGYNCELGGHLQVAAAIANGEGDAGVTIRVAAEAYGLDFVPDRVERYDLVIPQREMDSAPVVAMLDALTSRRFAREVSQLCAYDTDRMGQVIARIN
ncbi:MAG TPA: substrate-binding domain-containing protein [Candidatus Binataceae bacterium]